MTPRPQTSQTRIFARIAGTAVIAWPLIPALAMVVSSLVTAERYKSTVGGLALVFLLGFLILWTPLAAGACFWGRRLLRAASLDDSRGRKALLVTPLLALALATTSLCIGLPLWTVIPLAVAAVTSILAQAVWERPGEIS